MRTIQEPATLVRQVLGQQKWEVNTNYRLLTFVVQQPVNDGLLLFNVLTKELLLLNPEEAAHVEEQECLIAKWFLVPNNHDDCKLSRQLSAFAKMLQPTGEYINQFTILTTTDCNARCFYCFENGTARIHMSKQTAERVTDYILANYQGKTVYLKWFGGEPLYNVDVIDIICKKLEEANVSYRSRMITNGYLFDDYNIQRAKTLWNLNKVAITLDGTEETYNHTKRYIYKDGSAYQRVMSNIKKLLMADMYVAIRLNIGRHNDSDMKQLIGELARRFKGYSNIAIQVKPIINVKENNQTEYEMLTERAISYDRLISSYGINAKGNLPKSVMYSKCAADNPHSVIIFPLGQLGRCECYTDKNFIGDIYTKGFHQEVYESFLQYYPEQEECATCPIFPQCLRLRKCPTASESCPPSKRKSQLHAIKCAMLKEYRKFKQQSS